jgi:hypothetical protein
LPEGVDAYAIAGNAAKERVEGGREVRWDGLVSVESALGRHERRGLTLAFPEDHQWIAPGTGHLDLLGSTEVYEKLREWLANPPASPSPR